MPRTEGQHMKLRERPGMDRPKEPPERTNFGKVLVFRLLASRNVKEYISVLSHPVCSNCRGSPGIVGTWMPRTGQPQIETSQGLAAAHAFYSLGRAERRGFLWLWSTAFRVLVVNQDFIVLMESPVALAVVLPSTHRPGPVHHVLMQTVQENNLWVQHFEDSWIFTQSLSQSDKTS